MSQVQSIEPTRTEPVFTAKSDNLLVIRATKLMRHFEGGRQQQISPGLRYQFENGTLRVTDEMRAHDRRFFEQYGEHYAPDTLDGEFLSTDEWLRKRSGETGDFFELPVIKPDSGPVLEEIANAVIDGDEDRVTEIYAAEEDGHQREDVLAVATRALQRLEGEAATSDEVPAAEDAATA